jgi:uncharacterized protein (DUF58 family)
LIYPTGRAIVLAALGAPVALGVGVVVPGGWIVAGGWVALILGLTLLDALIGPARGDVARDIASPLTIGMGAEGELTLYARFDGAAPARAWAAIEADERLAPDPDRLALRFTGAVGEAAVRLVPHRRGTATITGLWLRWPGPLGLVWKQSRQAPAREIAVVPDLEAVRETALRLFSRDALFGIKTQLDTGDGAEFHALREMTAAMDTRAIDWKQSARHGKLLGKEYRTERNHPVVFAIDCGRLMCEPLSGAPRLDHALNAALRLAYVCLKLGDRVAVFGFDARPRLFSGFLNGAPAFPRLRRHVAALDYSSEETNFTLGLTQLGAALGRRSLVVVFTDFADTTSARLMLQNVTRLTRRHRVLFVVMRDDELEAIVRSEPRTSDDVSRAVTAAALLRSRAVVVERLRRLGVRILEAPATGVGAALITAYLDLKRAPGL